MVQRVKDSESGAALMIVLMLVVLVSIVGTAMLTTTTYGLKNVVKTTKEQKEFYLAEGAIEILLNEIATYQSNKEVKEGEEVEVGPLVYLREQDRVESYLIGTKEVEVTIDTDVDPNTMKKGDSLVLTLNARYKNTEESLVTRVMNVGINVDKELGSPFKKPYNYVTDTNLKYKFDSETGEHQIRIPMERTELPVYESVINDYKVVWPESEKNNNNHSAYSLEEMKRLIETQSYPIKEETLVFDSLVMSGNNDPTITIPENKRVFIKNVSLRGSANNGQIVIKGALIINKLDLTGNALINVHSGIIINEVEGTAQRFKVYSNPGEAKGISCELMKITCDRVKNENLDKDLTSSLEIDSINFSTKR